MSHPDDQTLYLIDGSGFIFRAYHALPPMTRADGTPINAVYGFCNIMQKLMLDLHASHMAVIFDAARKTFRNEIYADYKAHRPPAPDDLVPQFPIIREATRAFGVPSIELPNYEADDLIAAYARKAAAMGQKVRIVSADKDLMQLIGDNIELYDPMKNIPIGEEQVMKKFGVTPSKVIDVQALAGDSADNVPGVPGIGVKTAALLINEYDNLESLLDRAGEIKQKKRRENLIEFADLARISKKLVTLDDQAPLPLPVEELVTKPDYKEGLLSFLNEQNFRALHARISKGASTSPKTAPADASTSIDAVPSLQDDVPLDYELVQTMEALTPWINKAKEQGFVAIDTETDSLTPSAATLIGISLSTSAGKACYIPLGHIDPDSAPEQEGGFDFDAPQAPKQIGHKECASALRELLADSSVLKIAHNMKYDMQVLAQHDLPIDGYDDTMLLSYVLAAGSHGHGLDELALRHFGHKMISFKDVAGTGRNKITFDRVPLDKACNYAAEDADFTLRLWELLKPQLATNNLVSVYEKIERPLVTVVAAMEQAGISVNADILGAQSKLLTKRLQTLESKIHKLAGREFLISSPKQLGEVLFTEMNLPVKGKKGKTGAPSTSVAVLEPLAEEYKIARLVLDWRGLSKLKSTYTDALPQQINKKTERVHTSFSLVGAATGRLSSTDPNLQNIPIRTEEGRAIREAFVAKDDHQLLSIDYSQIELRLVAEAASISALIEAFKKGDDIHALTASQVFDVPMSEMTPEIRRQAKAINFGIIYGISGFGLAKQLGIGAGEATNYIHAYLDRFHELRDWMETTKEFARAHGYVETMFGRRVHIPTINDKNGMRRQGAERQAINAPLQGTAADIIKRAMNQVPTALEEANLKAKLLLQVHDELIFEVADDELEATTALVKDVMENAAKPVLNLSVPLVAEAGHAKNWALAH